MLFYGPAWPWSGRDVGGGKPGAEIEGNTDLAEDPVESASSSGDEWPRVSTGMPSIHDATLCGVKGDTGQHRISVGRIEPVRLWGLGIGMTLTAFFTVANDEPWSLVFAAIFGAQLMTLLLALFGLLRLTRSR